MHEPYSEDEARLAALLRARAAVAVSEVDGLAIARMVIASGARWRLPGVSRLTWLAAVLPFALLLSLLASLVAGTLLPGMSPTIPSTDTRPSGDIAVAGAGISLVSLADGSARWLSTGGADVEAEFAFSPTGRDLAALDVDRLSILDSVAVGPPRVFPGYSHMAGRNVPAWSPDGMRIALVVGSYEAPSGPLIVLDLGTGSATRIRDDITDAQLPAWSPDGQWIAFGTTGESPALRLVRPDGRDPARRIADGWTSTWSPDGRRIATVAGPTLVDDTVGISVVDLSTGVTVSVQPPSGTAGIQIFGWSPDQRELLCVRDQTDIGFLDVATGNWRHVATGTEPRLSPDGRWVGFVARLPGQPQAVRGVTQLASGVYVTDALGAGEPILVAPNVSYYGLAWRPVP